MDDNINESYDKEEGRDSDVEMDEVGEADTITENDAAVPKLYLPGKPLKEGEELVCDPSAYIILRDVQTGAPCLSFDLIDDTDALGTDRVNFPATCYAVSGTQAQRPKDNNIIVMKMSNLHKTQTEPKDENSDDDESSSDEEDDEDGDSEKSPRLDYASIAHYGCINRIRATTANDTILAASWSEMGRVSIWNLKEQIQAVNDMKLLAKYRNDNRITETKPIFTFSGHQCEGFAVDWCPTVPGVLATGDCKKNIHIWNTSNSGWQVDQKPLIGHTSSVEDLQWSPNEPNVLASASVDKSIRIWDTRAPAHQACMITVTDAHASDVNVIHWNRNEPFVVSGGDDGCLRVWDLRQLKEGKAIATFKHHTGPVTTVEWHPTEPTVLASGGEDDQIALWDLSVERDEDSCKDDVENLPPQLLFIHQGQQEVKELHWHKNIPGLILSTAHSGFNIFKTISV